MTVTASWELDNCVDRWAEDPARASRPAIIWEGEPGDVRTVTYAGLADQVSRLAGALASLGVAKGDVVAIYMPNAVEAFTAVHACNRIGAIYTILFSGFGPGAVRSRLEASRAKDLAGLQVVQQAVQQSVAAEAAPSA
jgi:acetyl-CoA synthetase